jgi:hypothetical protein
MDQNNKALHQKPFMATPVGFPRTQYALVTHHGLAAVACQAIRNHPWAQRKPVSAKVVMALANNGNNVEDPFLGPGLMTLVRVLYKQAPYQELYGDLLTLAMEAKR